MERPAGATRFVPLMGLLIVVAAACSGGSTPSSSGGSTAVPTSSGTIFGHATGAADVVFRFEEGGGFVPIDFFATQAPQLTLYGDGTVIFRDALAPQPSPLGTIYPLPPFAIARLTEPEVQSFLRFALIESGLGVARGSYDPGGIADAPTATFTIHAGGVDRTVSVVALGFDNPQSPDRAMLKALAVLGTRVRAFGAQVQGESEWVPDRYRGALTEGSLDPTRPWPWTDVQPADFVRHPEPDAPRFAIRTLTSAEVARLGLTGIEGGFRGLALAGPDGAVYQLALRPLLPDEPY